jgi:hypothetical protein
LRQFVESNQNLQDLSLASRDIFTSDQVDILHGASATAQLKNLDMLGCSFANDGSLEHFLSACTKVEHLRVSCKFISIILQFQHFFGIRLTSWKIWNYVMNKYTDMNIDGTTDDDIMRELTTGLATNAKLKIEKFGPSQAERREDVCYYS